MGGVQATRNFGMVLAAIGAAAWILGLEGTLRTIDDGNGVNIGAAAALLVGRGLVALGAVIAVVSVVVSSVRRR